MVKCSSCGADNADHVDFCSLCFNSLQETVGGAEPSMAGYTECPTCLTRNAVGARFCDQCGDELHGGDSVKHIASPPIPIMATAADGNVGSVSANASQAPSTPATKSEGVAFLLSFLKPGLGHMYLGLFERAWFFLLITAVASQLSITWSGYFHRYSGNSSLGGWGILFSAVAWVICLIDSTIVASKIANKKIVPAKREPNIVALHWIGLIAFTVITTILAATSL